MFDDNERFVVLMALWNFKLIQADMAKRGEPDAPIEGVEAVMQVFDVIDTVVRKVGGDPNKVAFGAGEPQTRQ